MLAGEHYVVEFHLLSIWYQHFSVGVLVPDLLQAALIVVQQNS
jgi:hypothetical protein